MQPYLEPGAEVLVAGAGVTGPAVARALRTLGVRPTIADGKPAAREKAATEVPDVAVLDLERADPSRFAAVVCAPGFRPDSPLLVAAQAAGVPVVGDVELAWQADRAGLFGAPRTWLVVTGTNGKTTTTSMLEAILRRAGLAAVACGNIGRTVIDAVADPADHRVLAIELSSFQLHWAPNIHPRAGVVLNVAEDHLDWHGSMEAYTADKARALRGDVAVIGLDDPVASALSGPEVTVGFTTGEPGPGQYGVRDGVLVDGSGARILPAADVVPASPAGVADALAAAALAAAVGVPPSTSGAALAAFEVGGHRAQPVATVRGVIYIDDSKATNPHAARVSLSAHERVVWIAGGQLKGADVAPLVADTAPRLAGAVLLGVDAGVIAEALARHAPDVPVVRVSTGDDGDVSPVTDVARLTTVTAPSGPDAAMDVAVRAAARMAEEGGASAVLLAPAAASLDMFTSYGHRGDAFATSARALAGERA
ncbi:UDP-N-acetylmuramoyl-L-alanine--D-glutamate ligase [Tsukamurella sp. 8F]|uniref:UDP-N-acetylmuramoyl-L-alanine--D-glutamate ligase n=1 Tax=unclassified Tsukamurella TaxID=2633480 RepID=UPI0023B9385F|nr:MULTISPECIES: UDP-N-acetylmuramoyl-L-alanine--D-glutamate ligase [unclassified Tsukamurella]MDF0532461.1 UDP-N-acetylmuramoyl-L-alanine--D-glutamate ligase [Tsukamurella sp. 8J]MDF0588444.1 UDP-N-acetylmuramoyl-L-alanine--D-glutamate ligase [Tsukamurella sp. 8F]